VKPPAVSLWQKIFGAPVDQATTTSARSTENEQLPAAISKPDSKSAGDERTDFIPSRAEVEFQDIDDRSEAARTEPAPQDGEEPEQTVRKHTRRRRRGHASKGRRTAADADNAHDTDHRHRRPKRAVKHEERDRGYRARPLDTDRPEDGSEDFGSSASVEDDELDGHEDDATEIGSGDDVTSARSRSALQRSIPSWEEAIGFIVDTNMQSRSQRRQSANSGSRSNSSHGRGRRRRKN
jgi:hypothetical protein